MVAEVRADLYRRLDGPELIDLGNWQIHLRRSISKYLNFEPPEAANREDAADDDKQARGARQFLSDEGRSG